MVFCVFLFTPIQKGLSYKLSFETWTPEIEGVIKAGRLSQVLGWGGQVCRVRVDVLVSFESFWSF